MWNIFSKTAPWSNRGVSIVCCKPLDFRRMWLVLKQFDRPLRCSLFPFPFTRGGACKTTEHLGEVTLVRKTNLYCNGSKGHVAFKEKLLRSLDPDPQRPRIGGNSRRATEAASEPGSRQAGQACEFRKRHPAAEIVLEILLRKAKLPGCKLTARSVSSFSPDGPDHRS